MDVTSGKGHVSVVVEGVSDQIAIETLADRRRVDLAAAGIRIVRLGGAHRIGSFLDQLGLRSDGPRVAGLCDAGEEPVFRRALERTGFGSDLTRADMEQLGFYVCVADLEDELIRALGASGSKKSSTPTVISIGFGRCSRCRSGAAGPPRSSFGGSWAAAGAARSATPASSSTRSISSACLGHST